MLPCLILLSPSKKPKATHAQFPVCAVVDKAVRGCYEPPASMVDLFDEVRLTARRALSLDDLAGDDHLNTLRQEPASASVLRSAPADAQADVFRDALRRSAQLSDDDDDDHAWPSRSRRAFLFRRRGRRDRGNLSLSFGRRDFLDLNDPPQDVAGWTDASGAGPPNRNRSNMRRSGRSSAEDDAPKWPPLVSRTASLDRSVRRQPSLGRSFGKLRPRRRGNYDFEEAASPRTASAEAFDSAGVDPERADRPVPLTTTWPTGEDNSECRRLTNLLEKERLACAEVLQKVASLQNALKHSEEMCVAQGVALRRLEDQLVNAKTQEPRVEHGLKAAKERFAKYVVTLWSLPSSH